jgi:hypothetical protein
MDRLRGSVRFYSTEHPVPTYGQGRICACQGCDTTLSTYNPTSYCALHQTHCEIAPRARRSSGAAVERICAFAGCGARFVTRNPARKYCSEACRTKAWQERQRQAQQPAA